MKRKQKAGAAVSRGLDGRAMLTAAVQHLQAERFGEARAVYAQLLEADPKNAVALHHLGIVEHRLGRSDEGIALIGHALAVQPRNAHVYSDLAVMLMELRRYAQAAEACSKAFALDPNIAAIHSISGDLLLRQGDHAGAERAYARAIELQPDLAAAQAGRAEALAVLGRLDEAAAACGLALRHNPALPQAHGARGLIFYKRGRLSEAAAAFQDALRLDPGIALIQTRLGNVHHAQGQFEEALAAYERAIDAEPERAEFYCNKALALQELGRLKDACDAFFHALTIKPDFAEALTRLGILLNRMGRANEAIAALRNAVELAPRNGAAWLNLAGVLKEHDRVVEAAEAYRVLLKLGEGPMAAALFDYCHLRRHLCNWNGLEEAERLAIDALKACGKRVPPFGALAMACTPEDHLALARLWASGFKAAAPSARASLPHLSHAPGRRIRLGYLSTDFYDHATASLIAELFELHDRDRFELFAYCFSPDDGSAMRRRLVAAFDRFAGLREQPNAKAVEQIAGDRIDVLVDLKGYTRSARTIILAQRPAPVQVNYLGYPSTMGAPFIDYIIADPFIAPMAHQRFFDEKIVHLPDCYQPNDRLRRTAPTPQTRSECGLPESGFVFCAFNSVYKITAEIFSVWMRLLGQVPGSALWLLDANEIAKANLRGEAAARGVDPDRLVFAPKIPIAEHQARYAFADLFLDNLPVNAHTTASEALWAGLPVVTCAGEVFVGRVAGSLLHACRMPELVTHSLADYEALALRLATDRTLLAGFGERLQRERLTAPLFDIERYTRNLEAAFAHMMRLHADGQPPQAFAVADLPTIQARLKHTANCRPATNA